MDNKIKIFNKFTKYNNELYLTPQELYLYCYLVRHSNLQKEVITTIDLIHQTIPVKFHNSRDKINRKLIFENIVNLSRKRIINLTTIDEPFELEKNGKYNALTIVLNNIESKEFYYIDFDEFFKFKNYNHFYIYVSVRGYDFFQCNDGFYGRQISIKEFTKLLGVSNQTVNNYIDAMIKEKMLYKLVKKGNKDSNNKDKNRYRTIPFSTEHERTYENRYSGIQTIQIRQKRNNNYWGNDTPF